MTVPATHAKGVPPVLMDLIISHAFVWMEHLVTDVNVSNH